MYFTLTYYFASISGRCRRKWTTPFLKQSTKCLYHRRNTQTYTCGVIFFRCSLRTLWLTNSMFPCPNLSRGGRSVLILPNLVLVSMNPIIVLFRIGFLIFPLNTFCFIFVILNLIFSFVLSTKPIVLCTCFCFVFALHCLLFLDDLALF